MSFAQSSPLHQPSPKFQWQWATQYIVSAKSQRKFKLGNAVLCTIPVETSINICQHSRLSQGRIRSPPQLFCTSAVSMAVHANGHRFLYKCSSHYAIQCSCTILVQREPKFSFGILSISPFPTTIQTKQSSPLDHSSRNYSPHQRSSPLYHPCPINNPNHPTHSFVQAQDKLSNTILWASSSIIMGPSSPSSQNC